MLPRSPKRLREQLDRWRADLINLTKRNKLLYFKHTKSSSLEIIEPNISSIYARLDRTDKARFWEFRSVDTIINEEIDLKRDEIIADETRKLAQTELLTNKILSEELMPTLRNLDRRSKEQFVDTGLWTLYVAFGFLQWEDPSDKQSIESPLLLVPVELTKTGPQSQFRLQRTEEDPVINPALAEKLEQDFGIILPEIESFEEPTPANIRSQISKLVARHKNWSVTERGVLALFSFQKESMYKDLGQNSESILNHPMIQLLGLGPESEVEEFAFDLLPENEIDAALPPEEMLTIRDADSTQRRCIIAARDGKSFVMDGPPGTGKSQTISNIIAELIGIGKTVLFVSEKAAALDVVYKRLREAGLHEFVLNLHSHETSRKAVATELGRALMTRPRAAHTKHVDVAKLRNSRKKLGEYSTAINETRDDLGQSLHDAIGRVGQLNLFPSLDTSDIDDFGPITSDTLNLVCQEIELLATVWEPISNPDTFYWKYLIDPTSTQARIISSSRKLKVAIEKLETIETTARALSEDLNLGSIFTFADYEKYVEVLQLLDTRPQIPATGLVVARSFDESYLHSMQKIYDERLRLEVRFVVDLGEFSHDFHSADIIQNDKSFDTLQSLAPLIVGLERCTATNFQDATRILRTFRDQLVKILEQADRLMDSLEVEKVGPNLKEIQILFEILKSLAEQVEIPELWLSQPSIDKVQNHFQRVRLATEIVNSKFEELRTTFNESIVDVDATNLLRRFNELHRGLRKFSKQARLDKRTIKLHSPIKKFKKSSIGFLNKVVELQIGIKHMADATSEAEALLGSQLNGRETNFERLARSIEVAGYLLASERRVFLSTKIRLLLRDQTGIPPDELTDYILLDESLTKVNDLVAEIQHQDNGRLRLKPIPDVIRLLDENAQLSEELHDITLSNNATYNHDFGWSELVELARIHQKIKELDEIIELNAPRLEGIFGQNYQGHQTNWDQILEIGSWIMSITKLIDIESEEHAEVILSTAWSGNEVLQSMVDWQVASQLAIEEFEQNYQAEVCSSISSRLDDARGTLEARLENTAQIVTWSDYKHYIGNLEDMGLTHFAESLLEIRDADLLVGAAEKSLLELWIDQQIQTDKRVSPLHATDRDSLVNLFARLDRDLVDSTASQVINICSQRRPTSNIGAAAIIQRQSQLSRKHKPTKELLKETGAVAKLLKPCFMMSPMSVSRYLPSTMRFDAIIFDEASQVKPADAINSIYRGDQLIVAGDRKQLPPTSFFDSALNSDETTTDDYDEFESILDLCKSTGGLESLPLLWHYRSQHEDLITFSNYRFYDGLLKTFPSAQQNSVDLGLELFHVANGVYRRGGQRDNPIEAEAVVDRIIFHKQKHPNLSLGVVAFSVAQQDAIMAALENRSRTLPDLKDIISSDRLDGFFVKNLENVQGDDRDIIIFSIGYGPDEVGKITMNFGPMNGPSGNRRLNVAITRAKRRVEIVTSIRPTQFSNGITGGVKNLRDYLQFAEEGFSALVQGSLESEGDSENPFEADIANTIRSMGYEVVPQVGAAGYRIDIGVKHPDNSSQFILGVEADGATYHRTFVARDRDRLRQTVLEGLGWRFHRVWSTAWFRDRKNEEIRLKEALDSARTGKRITPRSTNRPQTIEVTVESVSFDDTPLWATEYKCTRLRPNSFKYEFNDPRATDEIASAIRTIVNTEGPVHEDRVLRIVREHYGIGRSGGQIRDSFSKALRTVLRGDYTKKDGFINVDGQNLSHVRFPNPKDSNSARTIDEIPPGEIDLSVLNLLNAAVNATSDELAVNISRSFGWARTGAEISAAVDRSINRLIRAGHLSKTGSTLAIK